MITALQFVVNFMQITAKRIAIYDTVVFFDTIYKKQEMVQIYKCTSFKTEGGKIEAVFAVFYKSAFLTVAQKYYITLCNIYFSAVDTPYSATVHYKAYPEIRKRKSIGISAGGTVFLNGNN